MNLTERIKSRATELGFDLVGIAPANYNIFLPNPIPHDPIAWMQTTGMGDGTCPWVNGNSTTQGAKFIAVEHATDNGCMIPADIPRYCA